MTEGLDDGASAPSGIFPRVIVRSTDGGADSRTDRFHRGVDALQKVTVLYPPSSCRRLYRRVQVGAAHFMGGGEDTRLHGRFHRI